MDFKVITERERKQGNFLAYATSPSNEGHAGSTAHLSDAESVYFHLKLLYRARRNVHLTSQEKMINSFSVLETKW